jgi:hypothetical protein
MDGIIWMAKDMTKNLFDQDYIASSKHLATKSMPIQYSNDYNFRNNFDSIIAIFKLK